MGGLIHKGKSLLGSGRAYTHTEFYGMPWVLWLSSRFRTCLEAEKIRVSNLTQALELERVNSKKFQDALESDRRRYKEQSDRQQGATEETRQQLHQIRQQKAEAVMEKERLRIVLSDMESELETERVLQGDELSTYFKQCAVDVKNLFVTGPAERKYQHQQ